MTVGELLVRVGIDASGLMTGMSKVESRMESFGTKLFYTGARISIGFSGPLAAAGAAVAKFGMDFDQAMTQSLAIMDDITPKIRQQMESVAKTVAEKTKFSADEAAEAYYSLASAGMKAEDAMAALPIVARFAQAGMMDMAKSSEFLTAAQAALGQKTNDVKLNMLNMEHVADVLTATNNLALGTIEDFAAALTNKAGAALRLVNKDIEEGAAVLAAYAERGIKGKTAGQQFWMMLRDLQVKATENAKAFKDLNIRVFDGTGNMRNMADIIKDFEVAMAGATDKQKTMMFQMLGIPARSRAATMAIMGSSDAIREYERQLHNAGGTTQDVADKQMKSLQNRLTATWHLIQNLGIEIFQSFLPTFEKWMDFVQKKAIPIIKDFGDWVEHLTPRTKEWTLAFFGLAVALGPVVMAMGSLVLTATTLVRLSGLIPLLQLMSKAATAGGIIASSGGVSAAANLYRDLQQRALPEAAGGEGATITAEEKLVGTMALRLERVGELVRMVGMGLADWAPQIVLTYAAFRVLTPMLEAVWDRISGTGTSLADTFAGVVTGEIGHIIQGFKDLLSILDIVDNTLGIIGMSLGILTQKVFEWGDSLDSYVAGVASSWGQQISDGLSKDLAKSDAWQAIVGMFDSITGPVKQDLHDMATDFNHDWTQNVDGFNVLSIAMAGIAQQWQEINTEAEKHGGWLGYLDDKTKQWYEDLKLIYLQRYTKIESDAAEAAALAKAMGNRPGLPMAIPGSPGYSLANPVNTREDIGRYTAAWRMMWSGNLGLDVPEGNDNVPTGPRVLKGMDKKIKDTFDSIMGAGESALNVLVKVWEAHRTEIMANEGALKEFEERYKKIRAEGHIRNPLIENTLGIGPPLAGPPAAENPFATSLYGAAGDKILNNMTLFKEAVVDVYGKGKPYVDAFWKANMSGMDAIEPFIQNFPPDVQAIINKYIDWAKVSEFAANSVVRNQEKVKLDLDQIGDQITAKLADANQDVASFTDNSVATQLRGMHRNVENQQQEYRRMIDRMKADALKLSGVERVEADRRVAIAEKEAKEIEEAEERANLFRAAAAVGFSQVWMHAHENADNATVKFFVEQRRHWLDWQILMEQNIGVLSAFADLFTALGQKNLGGALSNMAGAFSQIAKGRVELMSGENDTAKLGGLITMLGGVAKAITSVKQAAQGGAISGAIAGAFAGFQTGAMFGKSFGPWGALIGGLAGGIYGLITAGKKERQMLTDVTNAFIEQEGGIKNLTARMEALGMATDELKNPMHLSAEEFAKQLKQLDDLMQMREAQKALVTAHGSLYDLMKEAALARTDLNGVFDATNLAEYNSALDKLNAKFKEVQDRLQDMADASAGLKDQITGFTQQMGKAFDAMFGKGTFDDLMSGAQKIEDLMKKSKDKGIEQPEKVEGAIKSGTQGAGVQDLIDQAQRGLERMAFTANNIFTTTLASTGNILTSINTVGDDLDGLIELEDKLHIHTSDANTEWLLGLRRIMNANPDLMLQIQGLAAQETALSKAKRITQGQFDSFGSSAVDIYKELFKRTGNATAALQLMQPVLQGLWDAENRFGLKADDATQSLIDQAAQAGLIDTNTKPQFEDLYAVMQDIDSVLWDIAKALGVVRDTSKQVQPPDLGGFNGPGENDPRKPTLPDPTKPPGSGNQPIPPANPPHQMVTGGMVRYMAGGGFTAGWGNERYVKFPTMGTDSVAIMASPGEFMINARATARNQSALEYLNSTGTLPHGGTFTGPSSPRNQSSIRYDPDLTHRGGTITSGRGASVSMDGMHVTIQLSGTYANPKDAGREAAKEFVRVVTKEVMSLSVEGGELSGAIVHSAKVRGQK